MLAPALLLAVLPAAPAPAGEGGAAWSGLVLRDAAGELHDLGEPRGAGPLVLAITDVGCPISGKYAPRLAELHGRFAGRGVEFLAVDASPQDTPEEVARFADEVGLTFPVLLDEEQELAAALGARTTTEVFVVDASGELAYRGAVDDQYEVGAARPAPRATYLVDALEALLDGRRPPRAETPAPGCRLTYAAGGEEASAVTWAGSVKALVQRSCETCHRAGGSAPFSLAAYEEARGWSAMMAEVVAEGRMPPWNLHPEYAGLFRNERSLTAEERAAVLAWARSGAPRGDAAEEPPDLEWATGWKIGEPDAHFRVQRQARGGAPLPAEGFRVPRQGVVPYQYFTVRTDFAEDRWIRAIEVTSEVPAVVHHILVLAEDPGEPRRPDSYKNFLAVRAPGEHAEVYPEGYARRLPAGARLLFQVHYAPNGAEHLDRPGVAMVFADAPPRHEIVTDAAVDEDLRIPPHAAAFEVRADWVAEEDIGLLAMTPHMHSRGAAMRYVAHLPGGESRELLSCDFDVDWQESYILREPIPLPKGTRIEAIGTYDNSAANPDNPDPSQWVRWGDQTWEEMFIGYFNYVRPVAPAAEAR